MYITRRLSDVVEMLNSNIGFIKRDNQEIILPDESEVEKVVQEGFHPHYFIYTKHSLYFVYMNAVHEWKITMLPR